MTLEEKLAEVRDKAKEGTAKKMSAGNERSFKRMKNKLNKNNKTHETEIALYKQVRREGGREGGREADKVGLDCQSERSSFHRLAYSPPPPSLPPSLPSGPHRLHGRRSRDGRGKPHEQQQQQRQQRQQQQ